MGTIKFVSKKHLGSGNFEYTYSCFCSIPQPLKEIKVTSGNDNEAKQLAQLECDEHCNNSNVDTSQSVKLR